MEEKTYTCPHCNQQLKKWLCPPESSWDVDHQYVCFNDECSYYVRGWDWMKNKFNQNISYRYRLNPANGESGPLPVWSKDALKNFIIE
ncbi:MAG: ogr/Delta-like zinc finger family protein [Ignavibacteriaceae bacterium]